MSRARSRRWRGPPGWVGAPPPPPELAEADAEIVEGRGETGEEGGVVAREVPVDGDGLLGGLERLLPPPELAEAGAEIAEGHGEVGEEGPFVLRDELPQFSDADLAAVRAVTPGVDPEVVVFSRRSRSELREIVVNAAPATAAARSIASKSAAPP